MKLTYNPKTDIDRLNLLNSDEKVDLELGLLQSDYTYRENKGDVARIIAGYGLTDAYKAGGWNALSPEAQADINAAGRQYGLERHPLPGRVQPRIQCKPFRRF